MKTTFLLTLCCPLRTYSARYLQGFEATTHWGTQAVCGEVTYVYLTVRICKEDKKIAAECAVNLQSANKGSRGSTRWL